MPHDRELHITNNGRASLDFKLRILCHLLMEGWAMRRVLAIGSAALLAFTVTTTPLSAADLGMPTKAPVYKAPEAAPEVFDWWPLLLLLAIGIPLGLCIGEVICHPSGPPSVPPTTGGNNKHDVL